MADETPAVKHPNRDKPEAIRTRVVVAILLILSSVLVAVITIGGWAKLQGALPVNIFYIIVYVLLAFYVMRWNRGVLPVASALGVFLIIFATVSAGAWFARDKPGFTDPALPAALLGYLTVLLIPLQAVLIAFAMRGFQQNWHVEAGTREYFEATQKAEGNTA